MYITSENQNNFYEKIIPYIVDFSFKQEESLIILPSNLLYVLNSLKMHIHYQYLILNNIIGVDLILCTYRFSIIYDLLSVLFFKRLKIKLFLNNLLNTVVSCFSVYKNAIWWEREVWDMFGTFFKGNPDLRRILTDYGFFGYPLKKDFPLSGYSELFYNFFQKKIYFSKVELNQEFRFFNYDSNW